MVAHQNLLSNVCLLKSAKEIVVLAGVIIALKTREEEVQVCLANHPMLFIISDSRSKVFIASAALMNAQDYIPKGYACLLVVIAQEQVIVANQNAGLQK